MKTNNQIILSQQLSKAFKTVATGNVKDMANESKVYFWDNKKKAMSFEKKKLIPE